MDQHTFSRQLCQLESTMGERTAPATARVVAAASFSMPASGVGCIAETGCKTKRDERSPGRTWQRSGGSICDKKKKLSARESNSGLNRDKVAY